MKKLILLLALFSLIAEAQTSGIKPPVKATRSRVVATAAGAFWSRLILMSGDKDIVLKNLTADTAKVAIIAADTLAANLFNPIMIMSGANNVEPIELDRFRGDTLWYKGTASTSILIHQILR